MIFLDKGVIKMADLNNTLYFKVKSEPELQVKEVLDTVYRAMAEKGYNPVNQIVGYIMSGILLILQVTKVREALL